MTILTIFWYFRSIHFDDWWSISPWIFHFPSSVIWSNDICRVTRRKSPNVYKSCPKMISPVKWKILTPLQNLPRNVGDLGKLISTKGFKKLPKVQKSPNLVSLPTTYATWEILEVPQSAHEYFSGQCFCRDSVQLLCRCFGCTLITYSPCMVFNHVLLILGLF